MSEIYTRDFRSRSYSPPPGYDGNAFSDGGELRREGGPVVRYTRNADGDNDGNIEEKAEERDDAIFIGDDVSGTDTARNDGASDAHPDNVGVNHLSALLESLKGRLGREELIILLVMLLVSSDGICAEVLLLALVLFAG